MRRLVFTMSLVVVLTVLATAGAHAGAEGEITVGASYIGVSGDQGRFREDHFKQVDKLRGLEYLRWSSSEGDNKIDLEIKGILDEEYLLKVKYTRADIGYLLLEAQRDRRYYDGSNEKWDPAAYGLTGTEVILDNRTSPAGTIDDGFYTTDDFVERPDSDLYTTRMDITLEAGLNIPDYPQVALGWHRWERDGRELLLRGERARVTNPNDSKGGMFFPRTRAVAALSTIDGVSDLFYIDVAKTVADKYNLGLRHEYETYRDEQYIEFPRYKWDQSTPSAVNEQYRTFEDEPEFENSVTIATADSQLNDATYVSLAYMYNKLTDTTTRDVVRPTGTTSSQINHTVGTDTEAERKSHVGTGGFRRDGVLGAESVSLIAGVRVESAKTDAETSLLHGGTTPRDSMTSLDELRLEETAEVLYRGIPKTVVSVKADLEQRNLDWEEYDDIGSYETFGAAHFNSGIQFFDYAADVEHRDYEITAKAVNRSVKGSKVTGAVSVSSRDRDYSVERDADPRFFPGRIGGYKIEGTEAEIGLHQRLNGTCSLALKYQYSQEDISADFANGETQDWMINRFSASLAGAPVERLFMLTSVIYEQYDLKTPVNITDPASNWAPGTSAYDYEGTYATLLLNADCTLTEAVSANAGAQVTGSLGDNEYTYTKVGAGMSYMPSDESTVKLAYEFYDFNDDTGGLDNYDASATTVSYTRAF